MLAQQALPAAVAGEDKAIGLPELAAGTSTMARARWSATSAGHKSLRIPGTILPGAMAGAEIVVAAGSVHSAAGPLCYGPPKGEMSA